MTIPSSMSLASPNWSPLNRLQNTLQRDIRNGSVKSEDQDALTAALSDIDTQLRAGATTAASATGETGATTTPPAPGTMKAKVSGLIDDEVSSGKLTPEQAKELKSVFAEAARHMHGHHGGGKASVGNDGDSDDTQTAAVDSTSSNTAPNFLSFLQSIQQSLESSLSSVVSDATSAVSSVSAAAGSAANSAAKVASAAAVASVDPKMAMVDFLKQLQTMLGASATYGAKGANPPSDVQSMFVNAIA